MRIGEDPRPEKLRIEILTGTFFGEDDRDAEIPGGQGGDADAGGFYGQDLVDAAARVEPDEFFSHFAEKLDVHLMIQKAADLEDIAL